MSNLNSFLQPVDSPIVMNQSQYESGYDWNASNERGAITAAYIRSLSFNSAQGGTATLGGSGNGNGFLIVKDASGSTIVTINNAGIYVTGGNIQVYNASNQLTFDASGLVSSPNFINSNTSQSGGYGQIVTSSSYTDLTGSSMSVVLARATYVLVLADFRFKINSAGGTGNVSGEGFFNISIGGTPETNTEAAIASEYDATNKDHYGAFIHTSASVHTIKQFPAGTTAITAVAKLTNTANAQIEMYNYKLSYVLLGT